MADPLCLLEFPTRLSAEKTGPERWFRRETDLEFPVGKPFLPWRLTLYIKTCLNICILEFGYLSNYHFSLLL